MSPSCATAKVPVGSGICWGFLIRIQNMNMLLIHAVAHKRLFSIVGNGMCTYNHADKFDCCVC